MSKFVLAVVGLGLLVALIAAGAFVPWLSSFFLSCFIFGLVFTVASFLLGGLGHALGGHDAQISMGEHVGHLGHVGHGGAAHGPHAAGHGHATDKGGQEPGGLMWLNFNALILFVTWFGACGYIAIAIGLPNLAALGLGIIGGVAGYSLVLLFLNKVLNTSQTPIMRTQDYEMAGIPARVSSSIFEGGTGEIIYTRFGTLRSEAARSVNGQPIAKGTEVVVLRYQNGVAYVEDLKNLLPDLQTQLEQL